MARVQLALNVTDINQAIAFYSKMFNTEPAKVREGYANFAIVDPPLKLVLSDSVVFGSAPVDGGDVCCATTPAIESVSLTSKPGCC